MKATGMIRKIDDLGRIVIPKEIRKTLKIKEGDTLEIYVEKTGEVILKRYAPFGDLVDRISMLAEATAKSIGCNVIITDSKSVIAENSNLKNKYIGKELSEELLNVMEERAIYGLKEQRGIKISEKDEDMTRVQQLLSPIIVEGNVVGSVMFLSSEERRHFSESELKILQLVTDYITKEME